jgi:hypothetical protein
MAQAAPVMVEVIVDGRREPRRQGGVDALPARSRRQRSAGDGPRRAIGRPGAWHP